MTTDNASYRSRASGSAPDLKEQATEQFERIAEKATDKVRDFADQAERFAGRAAEQSREMGNQVQEVAGNLKGAVKKSVNDQPLATLAIVAVLGFVLGALWKK